jgi:RIO kinase 1
VSNGLIRALSNIRQANVYHAFAGPLLQEQGYKHLAIKVYKTSILTFKDRDRYVTGEYRFKGGYAKKNPRKMVRLWAEKELRNLRRLRASGVDAPEPIEVRGNVLVMSFLGAGSGWACVQDGSELALTVTAGPRRDLRMPNCHPQRSCSSCTLTFSRSCECSSGPASSCTRISASTTSCACIALHSSATYSRRYHDGRPFIIDVSQSVEQDHPHAFDFLRQDLTNIDDFFSKRGVSTLGLKATFQLIVATEEYGADDGEFLLHVQRHLDEPYEDTTQGDATFKDTFIPRTLHEVFDAERDVAQIHAGQGSDLIYASLTGVAPEPVADVPKTAEAEASGSESDGASDSGSGSDDEDDSKFDRGPKGKKFEDKGDKKERKQAVKDENREKRKNKMKKAEKKRRIARTAAAGRK